MTYACHLMRSSVVPHTIASDTAQNTNWKKRSAAGLMSYVPRNGMSLAADAASWPTFRNQPCVPAMAPAPPKANAKPHCMNMTSTPATVTQVVSMADAVSGRVGPDAADATPGTTSRAARAASPEPAVRARLALDPPCRAVGY